MFDESYINLFGISQLLVEYLIYNESRVLSKAREYKKRLEKKEDELSRTHKNLDILTQENLDLKLQIHQCKETIRTYESLLRSTPDLISGRAWGCSACNKAFSTSSYLEQHFTNNPSHRPEYKNYPVNQQHYQQPQTIYAPSLQPPPQQQQPPPPQPLTITRNTDNEVQQQITAMMEMEKTNQDLLQQYLTVSQKGKIAWDYEMINPDERDKKLQDKLNELTKRINELESGIQTNSSNKNIRINGSTIVQPSLYRSTGNNNNNNQLQPPSLNQLGSSSYNNNNNMYKSSRIDYDNTSISRSQKPPYQSNIGALSYNQYQVTFRNIPGRNNNDYYAYTRNEDYQYVYEIILDLFKQLVSDGRINSKDKELLPYRFYIDCSTTKGEFPLLNPLQLIVESPLIDHDRFIFHYEKPREGYPDYTPITFPCSEQIPPEVRDDYINNFLYYQIKIELPQDEKIKDDLKKEMNKHLKDHDQSESTLSSFIPQSFSSVPSSYFDDQTVAYFDSSVSFLSSDEEDSSVLVGSPTNQSNNQQNSYK